LLEPLPMAVIAIAVRGKIPRAIYAMPIARLPDFESPSNETGMEPTAPAVRRRGCWMHRPSRP